jgi:hypothetical protein
MQLISLPWSSLRDALPVDGRIRSFFKQCSGKSVLSLQFLTDMHDIKSICFDVSRGIGVTVNGGILLLSPIDCLVREPILAGDLI